MEAEKWVDAADMAAPTVSCRMTELKPERGGRKAHQLDVRAQI